MRLSDWEAKAWLGVLFGFVLGCVVTVWMAVENEIDHYYRPSRLEIGPVEVDPRVEQLERARQGVWDTCQGPAVCPSWH